MATVVDIWHYRRLLPFVGGRALRKIYRRTALGWLWLFINPLFPLALRALVFGALLGVGSDGVPYFLFLLGGTILWDVFANSLMWGTRSLEMNRDLTDRVYHPRAILPLGNVTPAAVDLAIKSGVFVLALMYYAFRDGHVYVRADPSLVWAAIALLMAALLALAISFFTAVWGESARDARFALGQLLAIWYLLTPVLYPISQVPEAQRRWFLLNPLATIAETFKWSLFGIGEFHARSLLTMAIAIPVLFLLGLMYFARAEARTSQAR
jgi:lipopolysaccharide transport system permease protein